MTMVGKARAAFVLSAMIAAVLASAPAGAGAHPGHLHYMKNFDGRIPGQPDFKKMGDTTYDFLPGRKIYKVTRPGEPPQYMHVDPPAPPGEPGDPLEPGVGGWVKLPTYELAPVCRNWGNRIIINYDGPDPVPTATLRSVVKRMNWKIADQASKTSGWSRVVKMAVECDESGQVKLYHYSLSEAHTKFGSPQGVNAIKVLTYVAGGTSGASPISMSNVKSRQNRNAQFTSYPWMSQGSNGWGWESHSPMHELFHSMGATQGTGVTPKAPYSTTWTGINGFHCVDGWDVMCYEDGGGGEFGAYTETRCPAFLGFNTPGLVPLDCGSDTYFDAAATPGTYLANYWNIGEPENPYLTVTTSTQPKATTTSVTLLKAQQGLLVEAELNGTVVPSGDYATFWFEWGPTTSYGSTSTMGDAAWGTSAVPVSTKLVGGIEREKTYHYRVVGKNEAGTVFGEDKTFVASFPPTATTGSVSELTTTGAKLNGVVNPKGSSTTYQLEYGTATSYGASVPVPAKSTGGGTSEVAVNSTITGLQPGQTYHYRVVATSAGGTVSGADKTFTAKDVAPQFASSFGSTGSGNGQFNFPRDIALDSGGNIWVADGSNDRVQKFNSKGEYLSKFGSTGSGNGQFHTPVEISTDSSGNLWVTDAINCRVQKFNSSGTYLSQFGSCGERPGKFNEASGLAIDSSGNVWVSDHYGTLQKFNSKGEYLLTVSGGPELGSPSGVAIDPEGAVWLADMGGNKVVQYSSAGAYKSYFGSWGEKDGEFMEPGIIEFAANGNLWVGDRYTGRIQEMSQSGEYLTQFGGGKLAEPGGFELGPQGVFFVSNSLYINRVERWQVTPPEATTSEATSVTSSQALLKGSVNPVEVPTTYAFEYGTTVAYGAKVPVPDGSAGSGSGAVAVSDLATELAPATSYHFRLVATNSSGAVKYGEDKTFKTKSVSKVFSATIGPSGSENGQFSAPHGIAIDSSGNIWVVDTNANRLQKLSPSGEYLAKFGSEGTGNGQFKTPLDVAIDSSGNIWVTDVYNCRVEKFNSAGTYLSKFGTCGTGNGQFVEPNCIAIDSSGNIWVSDHGSGRLQKFNSSGTYLLTATGGPWVEGPAGVAVDTSNDVWLVDSYENRVLEYSSAGAYKSKFGSWGSEDGQLAEPGSVEIYNNNVWVTDRYTGRTQAFTQAGEYLGQFGGGWVAEPGGLAISSTGIAYVSSTWFASRVDKYVDAAVPTATSGSASSVAARSATLNATVNPKGLATTYSFEYGKTTAYGSKTSGKEAGSGFANVEASQTISGLEPNTTYHFRVLATNAEGTSKGADKTFTTTKAPPLASTVAAFKVKPEGATLNATVNPEGFATTYQFEWGKTTSYGNLVPASPASTGSGTTAVEVSQPVSGLEPSTTYHFRVVATSAEGTTNGTDRTFSTDTAGQLAGLPVTEALNESSTSSFEANWSALGWASGPLPKGFLTSTGWRSFSAYPTVNGAYYATTASDSGSGVASVVTMATSPGSASRYFSLWLDMPTPSGATGGYELRFTYVSTNTYDVALSKWVEGSQTVLESKSGYPFAAGGALALLDVGSTISAWTDTGSGFAQLLSASDSAFSGGKGAIEGAGNGTRLTNFKVGSL